MKLRSTLPACVFWTIAAAPGGKREPPEPVLGGGIASALLTVIPILARMSQHQVPESLLHAHFTQLVNFEGPAGGRHRSSAF